MDLSTYPCDEVMSLVSQFQPKIFYITIAAGQEIDRIRPDVDVFNRKGMTYRPAYMNTKPQRATLPYSTAFYGTTSHYEEPLPNNYAIALFEASALCKGDKSVNGSEHYTLSRWRTCGSISLAVFAHPTVYPDVTNNMLLNTLEQELEQKKTFLDDPLQFDVYERYVTGQFAKRVK